MPLIQLFKLVAFYEFTKIHSHIFRSLPFIWLSAWMEEMRLNVSFVYAQLALSSIIYTLISLYTTQNGCGQLECIEFTLNFYTFYAITITIRLAPTPSHNFTFFRWIIVFFFTISAHHWHKTCILTNIYTITHSSTSYDTFCVAFITNCYDLWWNKFIYRFMRPIFIQSNTRFTNHCPFYFNVISSLSTFDKWIIRCANFCLVFVRCISPNLFHLYKTIVNSVICNQIWKYHETKSAHVLFIQFDLNSDKSPTFVSVGNMGAFCVLIWFVVPIDLRQE